MATQAFGEVHTVRYPAGNASRVGRIGSRGYATYYKVITTVFPTLTSRDVGHSFVRSYPHGLCQDLSFIPEGPPSRGRETDLKAAGILQEILSNGGLVFRCETNEYTLNSSWNDGHWVDPERYLRIIARVS
jgi:hypothetical protein